MGLSIQEKFKIDFQDGNCGGHLVFPIGTLLAIYLQVNSMILTKFQVNWPLGSGEEVKNRFSNGPHGGHLDGGHLGFLIGTILAFFDLQVTQTLPTQVPVNWPFGLGEEVEK